MLLLLVADLVTPEEAERWAGGLNLQHVAMVGGGHALIRNNA